MHLCVVSSHRAAASEFVPDPVALTRQPWRPGELCEIVDLDLDARLGERLDRAATTESVPVATVAIYS